MTKVKLTEIEKNGNNFNMNVSFNCSKNQTRVDISSHKSFSDEGLSNENTGKVFTFKGTAKEQYDKMVETFGQDFVKQLVEL